MRSILDCISILRPKIEGSSSSVRTWGVVVTGLRMRPRDKNDSGNLASA